MKCSGAKRLPETIQMKRYRKTNERLIVCVRLNSDCSKRVEIRVDNQVSQVNQVNHPDARSRSAIYVNVRPRQQLDNVKSPKTWRIFRVAANGLDANSQRAREQLAERKDTLADSVNSLQQDIDETARSLGQGQGQEQQRAARQLKDAAEGLARDRVADRITSRNKVSETDNNNKATAPMNARLNEA